MGGFGPSRDAIFMFGKNFYSLWDREGARSTRNNATPRISITQPRRRAAVAKPSIDVAAAIIAACSAAWTLFDTMQARRRRALLPRVPPDMPALVRTTSRPPLLQDIGAPDAQGHAETGTCKRIQTGPRERPCSQPCRGEASWWTAAMSRAIVVSHSVHHQRPATWLAQGRRARQTPSTASGKPRLGLAAPRGVPGASLLTVCTVGGELPAVCNQRLVL